ncbi:hypothetical protein LRP67_02720 [Nocardioides sp. cx-169]|uniref:hypothetical protein n=1 Tax=Nocardioides sp. cx-169 TaxID=2899080 RepID=UPI001E5F0562|nr:hypothetical protein [Nocardioides sp. cx-169]MCD4532994.1 hypothetical protein [Nocardioides sp. cx-169]
MKIGKPSLYAAFGGKEELFRKALDRYTAGPGSYALRAALEPTAKRVAEAFLLGTIAARLASRLPGSAGSLGGQRRAAGRPRPSRRVA